MHSLSLTQMDDLYKEQGITVTPELAVFYLVPDWDGRYLNAFGLQSADQYHCIIVHGDKVIANLSEDTPRIEEAFIEVIEQAILSTK